MNTKQKNLIKTWLIISFIISLGNTSYQYFKYVSTVYDKYEFMGPVVVLFIATFVYIMALLGIPVLILYIVRRDKK